MFQKGGLYMLWFAFMFGVFIGGVVTALFVVKKPESKPDGTLRIDSSDPDDGPYLFLELSGSPSIIAQKKYVKLKVGTKSYISHE
jgi:hypothetical protein